MEKLSKVLICIAGIGSFCYGIYQEKCKNSDNTTTCVTEEVQSPSVEHLYQCKVYGRVKSPGVYTITKNTTLAELFSYAGLMNDADVSGFDLDSMVEDGKVYQVFKIVEDNQEGNNVVIATSSNNINKMSKEELLKLPGIGDVRADSILNYIKQNGKIKDYDTLKTIIKGISNENFEEIKRITTLG